VVSAFTLKLFFGRSFLRGRVSMLYSK
jgi:hypothetical protein